MIEIPRTGIAQFIVSLAGRHAVRYERTRGDELAQTFTRLSGDEVRLDEAEELLLVLQRADVITAAEAFELFNRYHEEISLKR